MCPKMVVFDNGDSRFIKNWYEVPDEAETGLFQYNPSSEKDEPVYVPIDKVAFS